ncbi:MAG TPA: FxsB family cyclophane-forming radical SAM/SPASM peptide maturase [Actinoplanes sp.]|nr:FxsB family cyclophane-forming radical SAM/SPASM peptide maturase [Actinoplanes sp.]
MPTESIIGVYPFREFVIKVASRCDLACTYCYMYLPGDQSWKTAPRFISDAVVDRIGRAIGEHVTAHGVDDITIILHGGEPLLAGATRLTTIAGRLRAIIPPATRVGVSMQTNGVLLDETSLQELASAGIRVAVSLDGDEQSHDRHRLHPNGSGSHARAMKAVELLSSPEHRTAFAGLLCVVDLESDPRRTYRFLARSAPPVIDFLMPFGNWTTPPPGRLPDDSTPYGDWLAAAFDEWYDSPHPRPEVRLFREVVTLLMGGHSRTEQVGLSPACMIVFDVSGAMEQVDSLRTVGRHAASTAMSVFTHDLEDALNHPAIRDRQMGIRGLSSACQSCPLVRVCGGGHYVHRYREGIGFRERSVYCADLSRLIPHISQRVRHDIAQFSGMTR